MFLLSVYKPKGLTPLQTINRLREKLPEYKNTIIGFAGRLDPLAHGVLLLMIGEETTKDRDKFLNLPKQYEFEAVFGVSTDTYDVLGLLNNQAMKQWNNQQNLKTEIEDFIKSKLGKQSQIYPPYSSKPVNGKPLYLWARENKLAEITIPEREIEIFSFELLAISQISASKLYENISKQINSVEGDFRQKEIQKSWEDFFARNTIETFTTARFVINCSSGTYVRSLVNEMGLTLDTGAIALEIVRTKVGNYSLNKSIRI